MLASKIKLTDRHRGAIFKSNLAIALYLLPSSRRKDALLFYKFCHSIDSCVDDTSFTQYEKETFLKNALDSLKEVRERRQLDGNLLSEIIRGMQMDLTIHRYETFKDLRLYAWRVASAVGLICTQLFGASGKGVEEYAEHLGLALQLTNILRDVAEDGERGRIYLPLEDLQRFNVTEEEILRGTPSSQAIHLFDYEADRALAYFAKAQGAWKKISPRKRHLMRPARLMEAIYRTLLEKMKEDRYDVFHQRYRVGILKKISLALLVLFS